MTTEEIVELFNAAGESAGWKPGVGNPLVINYLTHFAKLVADNEREACAKCCEDEACGGSAYNSAAIHLASRIRARGNN